MTMKKNYAILTISMALIVGINSPSLATTIGTIESYPNQTENAENDELMLPKDNIVLDSTVEQGKTNDEQFFGQITEDCDEVSDETDIESDIFNDNDGQTNSFDDEQEILALSAFDDFKKSEFYCEISSEELYNVNRILTYKNKLLLCKDDDMIIYDTEDKLLDSLGYLPSGDLASDNTGLYTLRDNGVYLINCTTFEETKLSSITHRGAACVYKGKIYAFSNKELYAFTISTKTWNRIGSYDIDDDIDKCEASYNCLYIYTGNLIYRYNLNTNECNRMEYLSDGVYGTIYDDVLISTGGLDIEEIEIDDSYYEDGQWVWHTISDYIYHKLDDMYIKNLFTREYKYDRIPIESYNSRSAVLNGVLYVVMEGEMDSYRWYNDDDGEPINTNDNPTTIALGNNHLLKISNGKVYALGMNDCGQLGINNINSSDEFVRVDSLDNVISVAAGKDYSVALKSDGTVYTWGINLYDDGFTSEPHIVKGISNIKKISAGYEHVLMLDDNGNVWSFGKNEAASSTDGMPAQVTSGTEFVDISAGGSHSVAVDVNGNVWTCGKNDKGQAGFENIDVISTFRQTDIKNVSSIQAGLNHTVILTKYNEVYSFGDNSYGQLGTDCTDTYSYAPIRIGKILARDILAKGNYSFITDIYGDIYSLGQNNYGQLLVDTSEDYTNELTKVNDLDKVDEWTANDNTLIAISGDGNLLGWGCMSLANNDSHSLREILFPLNLVDIDSYRTQSLVIDEKGRVLAWGEGYYADNTDKMNTYSSPTVIKGISNPIQVSRGKNHNIVLDADGNVWGWGSNSNHPMGSLNSKVTTATKIPEISGVKQVSAGTEVSFFLKNDGSLWGVGKNDVGQLGHDSSTSVSTPIRITNKNDFKQISACDNYVAALADDGIYTWGGNDKGQLGNGTITNTSTPTKLNVMLEEGEVFTQVSAGMDFCLGLTNKGHVYAWGDNGSGELGQGNKVKSYIPIKVNDLSNIRVIEAGKSSAIAIDNDGNVYGWGYAQDGQLETSKGSVLTPTLLLSFTNAGIKDIELGYNFAIAVNENGKLFGVGNSASGQLGHIAKTPVNLNQIVATGVGVTEDISGNYCTHVDTGMIDRYKFIPKETDKYIFSSNGGQDTIKVTLYNKYLDVLQKSSIKNNNGFRFSQVLNAGETYYIKFEPSTTLKDDYNLYIETPLTLSIDYDQ